MEILRTYFMLLFGIFASCASISAQSNKAAQLIHAIEAGSLAGAEISRNTGDFKFAYAFRYHSAYPFSKQFNAGLGFGFEQYEHLRLLPIYLHGHAYLKPQINSSFFAIQIGISPGWHQNYQQLDAYEFKGGTFMGFDIGRRIHIQENIHFNIAVGLKFQNSQLIIQLDPLDDYKEKIRYILLHLKVSIGF